jgi:hypothetical protein
MGNKVNISKVILVIFAVLTFLMVLVLSYFAYKVYKTSHLILNSGSISGSVFTASGLYCEGVGCGGKFSDAVGKNATIAVNKSELTGYTVYNGIIKTATFDNTTYSISVLCELPPSSYKYSTGDRISWS